MKSTKIALIAVCASLVFLLGCQKTDQGGNGGAAAPVKLQPVPHAAWLSKRLPAETVGYVRLPGLWDAFFAPKEDTLHTVQVSEENRLQVKAIKQGLSQNLWNLLPTQAAAPAELLLEKMSSPLEMAALLPPDGSFVPNLLFGTTLEDTDNAGFSALIDRLTAASAQARVLTPMNGEGFLTLFAGPMPVYMHFEQASGRLTFLSGTSATDQALQAVVNAAESPSPLSIHEAGLDATGRGLAIWADVDRIWPLVKPLAPPEQALIVESAGLDQLDFLYLGTAAKGGKSSFLAHLQMPHVGFRRLLPTAHSAPSVQSAGTPDFAFRIVLPSPQEFGEAVDYALSQSADGSTVRAEMDKAKQSFDQWLGSDSSLILQAYGPEAVFVSDRAGYWVGYQVRDRAALDKLTIDMETRTDSKIDQRSVNGQTIYHWPISTMSLMEGGPAEVAIPPMLKQVLGDLREHIFWVDEGDYLVNASVPQVLMARHQSTNKVDVGSWLAESLQIDWSHAVFAAATTAHFSPRNVYHIYLQALLLLSDLSGADADPFAMPIWTEAGLPEEGRLGVRLDSSDQALTLRLDYEYSPVEVLMAGSAMSSLAVVGVLAAIAVPAYVDYEARAAVSEGLNAAMSVKVVVDEIYTTQGEMPSDEMLSAAVEQASSASRDVYYEDGVITVYFNEAAKQVIADTSLYMAAVQENGDLTWTCYSDSIASKHLPPDCRE